MERAARNLLMAVNVIFCILKNARSFVDLAGMKSTAVMEIAISSTLQCADILLDLENVTMSIVHLSTFKGPKRKRRCPFPLITEGTDGILLVLVMKETI